MSKRKRRSRSRARTKPRRGPSLVIPITVGVVVLAIIVGAIVFAESGPSAATGSPGSSTAQSLNTRSISPASVPRVSLSETQDKLSQDQAIVVDVRTKASYDKAHIAGAISIPEQEVASRLDELPRDKDIILYCT